MKKMIKYLSIIPLFVLMFFVTSNEVHALTLVQDVYSIYGTRLDYDSQSSISNSSIYQLRFQTQNVSTFEYEYISDLWNMFTYNHMSPTEYYIYAIPTHNVTSLQVINYSNNFVTHTLTGISYIIFDFNLQTVSFKADIYPFTPLVLTSSNINSADVSINLLIKNEETSYNDGFNSGFDNGYTSGYNDGYNIGNADGYSSGLQSGELLGYNDARLEYGFLFNGSYITGQQAYDLAIQNSSDNLMAIRDFLPGVLGSIFVFFFQISQISMLGISLLDILSIVVGIGAVILVIRIIFR